MYYHRPRVYTDHTYRRVLDSHAIHSPDPDEGWTPNYLPIEMGEGSKEDKMNEKLTDCMALWFSYQLDKHVNETYR